MGGGRARGRSAALHFPSLEKEGGQGLSWMAVVLNSLGNLRPGLPGSHGSAPSGRDGGARPRGPLLLSHTLPLRVSEKETESSSSGPTWSLGPCWNKTGGPWGSGAASLEGSGQGKPSLGAVLRVLPAQGNLPSIHVLFLTYTGAFTLGISGLGPAVRWS